VMLEEGFQLITLIVCPPPLINSRRDQT
jgi:hypothetical protein